MSNVYMCIDNKKLEIVNGEIRWMVNHKGEHYHQAPVSIHLSEQGRKQLIDILKLDLYLKSIELRTY